jgi:hypothetical protein
MAKIELEVSSLNEGTESPWWIIIDPKQNFSTGDRGLYAIAGMITGPFFSREEAQDFLDRTSYNFSKNAKVYCHSGYPSKQYKEACRKALIGYG